MHHISTLILVGRPAAGKSEVIDFLKKLSKDQLAEYHLGEFIEIDDFPFVWEMFEIDEIMSKYGKPRLFTDDRKYFKDDFLWTMLLERINLEYRKKIEREPEFLNEHTIIVEFSRGGEKAYRQALETLHEEILKRAGIVYIKVSYEESVRKNRRRYRPELADSILYHSLPDDKMEYYYKIDDWDELTSGAADGVLEVKGFKVPFAVLFNEPEVTDSEEKLAPALKETLDRLYEHYRKIKM